MKKKNYSQKTIKNITIVALFGLISAIGASSTLFFMKSSDSTANQPGGIVDNNGGNEEPEDLVKSKLFENTINRSNFQNASFVIYSKRPYSFNKIFVCK